MKYVFKISYLRNILIVSSIIAIGLPICVFLLVFPSFTKMLISNSEDESLRMARHLNAIIMKNQTELSLNSLTIEALQLARQLKKDFGLMKLKIFSKSGEIIYSTEPKDIGEINKKRYFHDVIAKGEVYAKLVKKDTPSREGQTLSLNVVEAYAPMMKNGAFIGALEIYYDVTDKKATLDKLISVSRIILSILSFTLLGVIIIVLIKAGKTFSSRDQAEEALQKAHDTLEQQVEERTVELVEANEQLNREIAERKRTQETLVEVNKVLERRNQELENFVYVASHDLQEPLRKVTAFGDRLKGKFGEALGDQGRDSIERMQGAAKRMQTLINGLLTYSRVSTKAQPFAPVDLNRVAREVLSDLEVRIEEVGGRVEVGHLPTIDADFLQMCQLLQNLVANALKFHKSDDQPVVRVSGRFIAGSGEGVNGDSPDNEFYQITVADNGIGFDKKYADRIFGVFQRLHGRSEYEGTGIGLAVCKRILERHGGSITAKSSSGNGAAFIVKLPVKQENGGNNEQRNGINRPLDG